MTTPRILRLGCLALALLAASLPAIPQQTGRYTVEFLLFRNDGDRSGEDGTAMRPLRSSSTTELAVSPVSSRRLAGAASKLRSAGGYRVIAHVAWTQAPSGWNSRRGVSLSELGVDVPGLSGNVILERGQSLHLGFDLKYEDGGRSLQLAEMRTVKVNDTHYFDHPQLGVIAVVSSSAP